MYYKTLILLLISNVGLAYGQTNNQLVKENKSWTIVNHNPSHGPNCIWQTHEIRLSGDTIIEGREYKIVRQSEFGNQPQNWAVVGFLREDQKRKVYFKNTSNENEFLLYDFDISIGDTVNIFSPQINHYILEFEFFVDLQMIVVSIDSVKINEGLRKRIKLNPICTSFEETYWIEGVGDTKGVLHSTVPIICGGDSIIGFWQGADVNELLCCKEDSLLLFMNASYNSCYYYSTMGINKSDKSNISINLYPNPIADISIFEISTPQSGFKHLEFYNISGKRIKTIETRENRIAIQKTDFQTGFYIYKLTIENELIKCGKMIVR